MGVGLRGSAVLGPSDQLRLLRSLPLLSVATVGLLVWEMKMHLCPVGAMESNKSDSQSFVMNSTVCDPTELLVGKVIFA